MCRGAPWPPECRIPPHSSALGGVAHRAGAIVEVLAGVAAEVLKRALVRLEELAQSLIGERAEEAAARESQREHEQVLDHHGVSEP